MADSAVHIIVHGRVQGVFFRASTQTRALELSLVGWVRNLPDSSVEIHAEGDRENLELLIEWCRQGPPSAKVTRVDSDWIAPQTMHDFQIR
ncbi:MAG: acylphosphatase [Nitrospinaceae bacterium]|mgnify:FL=1|jgi:acylphosphatase|nr:acylphosphatase [Nitrospinaceae bacterium]MDP6711276.1 acylphosphatase [Nitrospinaceae bacterium]HAK36754.1 acylphosphatase [Nitrospina sp.]|tara:strand:- start:202 stop:474 length:273 start_codon:yes stop_codon:yes gene_type:complete